MSAKDGTFTTEAAAAFLNEPTGLLVAAANRGELPHWWHAGARRYDRAQLLSWHLEVEARRRRRASGTCGPAGRRWATVVRL